jgi:hypothetical protein
MNTEDRFDDLIRERLRVSAPNEAPARVLEGTMTRISETPQRGRGWFGGTTGRLLAAAAVLLVAIVAGTQLAGLIDRPVGTGESPSPSVSPTTVPSATVAPSATDEPEPTQSPVGASDELLLRVQYGGGGPTYPTDLLPWVSLMADGTLVWQPVVAAIESPSLVTRRLSPEGLDELRDRIFGTGLLDASAEHLLEQRPDAPEPPGRGIGVFTFTAGGVEAVVVQSVEWLGDDEESTYYEPSPEREALDALARALRDPESMLGADAWTGPAEPFEGADYQLVLIPQPDAPPYGNPDIADMGLAYDGPIDEFGEATGTPGEIASRCGVITREEAARIVQVLSDADFGAVSMSMQTSGGIDWAEGNGTVDLFMLPRMPDGFPECADQR